MTRVGNRGTGYAAKRTIPSGSHLFRHNPCAFPMLNLEKPTFDCDVRGNHAPPNRRSQWLATIDSVIKATQKSDPQNVAIQLIASCCKKSGLGGERASVFTLRSRESCGQRKPEPDPGQRLECATGGTAQITFSALVVE